MTQEGTMGLFKNPDDYKSLSYKEIKSSPLIFYRYKKHKNLFISDFKNIIFSNRFSAQFNQYEQVMKIWFGNPFGVRGIKIDVFDDNLYWVLKYKKSEIYITSRTTENRNFKCWKMYTKDRLSRHNSLRLISHYKKHTKVTVTQTKISIKFLK